jgi:hypothetical protein
MKSRLHSFLNWLLFLAVLVGGVYAYRHPDVARRWLNAVTFSEDKNGEAAPSWVDRLNAPVQTVPH